MSRRFYSLIALFKAFIINHTLKNIREVFELGENAFFIQL